MDESAIGFAAFPGHAISFCHPHIPLNHGISLFFRGMIIEQILYRFKIYYIVYLAFIYTKQIIIKS